VYVPLDLLSGWIHAAATINPVTYLIEAARSLISGNPEGILLAFGLGFALVAVLGAWALGGLRRAEAAG
jgi:ABC-2 type transport system permease protein